MKNNKQSRKPWTEIEVDYLKTNRSRSTSRELAAELNRSVKSIEVKLGHLPNPNPKQKPNPKIPLNEPLADFWKREAITAQRKITTQDHDRTAVDVLVDKAVSLAPITYRPPKGARPIPKKSSGHAQPAVLMFSDCHVGQVIEPDQTLGLGYYNFDIFLRRLARLERSIVSIVTDHTTTEVPEIVVAMLGDILHGNLMHSAEADQRNTVFTQFYAAGHAIAQFLRNLSVIAPIRVETVVGNHPRFGHQRKMPTTNRYSNFDGFLLAYVQSLLADCPRIHVNISKQPFALFTVCNHHFYAGHGDHLRGGDAILGIPNHAIGRNLSNTAQNFGAAGQKFPNFFLFGHFHKPISLPHASGEVLVNGGFPGVDGYGLMSAFNSSKPSQKFFFVHPKFGKAASYDIQLSFGDNQPHGYELPAGFECK